MEPQTIKIHTVKIKYCRAHSCVSIMKGINPSASPCICGIDLCFFTCYRPLYIIQKASNDEAHLNSYVLHRWRSVKFPVMKLQPSIFKKTLFAN